MLTSGLGRLLIEDGLLTDLDFRTIKRTCGNEGPAFARSILAIGLLAEDELAAFLAEKTKWQVAPIDLLSVATEEALLALDKFVMQRLEAVPVKIDDGVLHVALVDPLDQETLSQLKFFSGVAVRPMIATLSSIRNALKGLDPNYRPLRSQLESFMTNHAMAASRQLRIGEGRILRSDRRVPALRQVLVPTTVRPQRSVTGGVKSEVASVEVSAPASSAGHHEAFAKADPPIGIETSRTVQANNEDLLDEGMHTPASDERDATVSSQAPVDNSDLLVDPPAEALPAGGDPLAELSDSVEDNDFIDEVDPVAAVESAPDSAVPLAPELATEPSAPPVEAAAPSDGDDILDEHPSDDQVESIFADEPLAELAGSPPVDVPADMGADDLLDEGEDVVTSEPASAQELAVNEPAFAQELAVDEPASAQELAVEEPSLVEELSTETEIPVAEISTTEPADELRLADDTRDLAAVAGINRAVLSLTMAASLEKAVERVAPAMASAGIKCVTLLSERDGNWEVLLGWSSAGEELQTSSLDLTEGMTVNDAEMLSALGEQWQALDPETIGQAKWFVAPMSESAAPFATAVSVNANKRIIVLVLSESGLDQQSIIGPAALDLCRRLAKKS